VLAILFTCLTTCSFVSSTEVVRVGSRLDPKKHIL
jgi:hypothetical protein